MPFEILTIRPEHDRAVCAIITSVGREFGAIGEGFGPSDAEVEAISQHYADPLGSRYLVAQVEGRIVGGCGVAAFGDDGATCELRKLFLLPEGRGRAIGRALAERCLNYAARKGYRQCYLDTLSNMSGAITLYEKLGFQRLARPLPGTLHNGCDVWMLKRLQPVQPPSRPRD
jgi:putative acetyltransferase